MRNIGRLRQLRYSHTQRGRHLCNASPACRVRDPRGFFGPFAAACVEIVQMQLGFKELVVEAFRWSLGLASAMFVRTIIEGLTIVMKAINGNSRRRIRNAIACAPRVVRAQWMLKSRSARRASRF